MLLIKKIVIEHHINFDKSLDIMIYRGGKLVEDYYDCSFDSVDEIVGRINKDNTDAVIEEFCVGEVCSGGWIRWEK